MERQGKFEPLPRIPLVSESVRKSVEATIPVSGIEKEFYSSLLNLKDIDGNDYGPELVSNMLSSKEPYKVRVLGTPSAGKTTIRLQIKGLVEDRSFGLHYLHREVPERLVMMWTFDRYMRSCAHEKGLGPVAKWSADTHLVADVGMVQDVDNFRNSEEVLQLQEQGYLVDFVDEIPYVHNENGNLLGRSTIIKAATEVQEEIAKKGYSTSEFLILLPDTRTLKKGMELRKTAIQRQGEEISGYSNGLTLQEELAEKGFYFVSSHPPTTDINRLIYQNARRAAPPRVVAALHERELNRAQEFYYKSTKLPEDEKRARTIFKKFVPSRHGSKPRALSESFYDYLKHNDPDEMIRLGVLAAYYDSHMHALGIPDENITIAVNEFKYSMFTREPKILVRLDSIDTPIPG